MNPRGINDEAEDPRAWIHGDESAKTMLARLLIERSLLLLPPLHRLPLRVGNVVEITGPSSSAKSQVLLQAAVHCILPKEWKGIRFGGLERIVIYFDLDCRFDVRRLTQILKFRILGVLGSINGSNRAHQEGFQEYHGEASIMNSVYDELIVACMKRFLYIRCYDSYEFLAALKTMHSRAQVESGVLGVGIHFLLIDSIGAFYWIDRSIQPSNSLDYKRGTMSFQHLVETIVQEIRKFLEVQPVLVLVSKASIFGAGTSIDAQRDIEMCTSSRDTDKVLYREYMPSAWQAFVTHRINLQLSDKYTNDKKGGTSPIYTSEWVQPPLNIKDQFAVADDGIYLI
ncbi:DNA repair protein XRCC2 homolog [Zingiber officinale]|uniref:DNA repair protein XRCC2 homolog n=1 Tax=Zingiber officinale TaxID=94328 RepID=UPI001C4BFF44|nr:DNA repair protein XRCC2 homolog [Zingiber officinale]